ncbi:MAG TPA: sigma-70 family RNA polymerase sigma factor [Gemmatimonadaceae bacterium]|nr:sigma-70 family RNA polymerase sigma factor [Gemmatimonadaceae bacterium]
MSDSQQNSVTSLLDAMRAGDKHAFEQLFPLVYDELHNLAGIQRRRWDGDETLDTTALVHEAYLRLVDQSSPDWINRPHFMAVAATAMRHILLDYAKRKHAAKRGGARDYIPLHELENVLGGGEAASEALPDALIALDAALIKLEQHNPRQRSIVECRFFGGMTIEDTAQALDLSPATVKRDWTMAQAWLYRELEQSLPDFS